MSTQPNYTTKTPFPLSRFCTFRGRTGHRAGTKSEKGAFFNNGFI
ncbi:MAG: hypothetical protein AVDCRST_MAG56-7611 [uncultured Cytophagales bacterium]|uniref:Uncharacterized protein n=1 Tax=uncultured Cytophagales bacterium TaxID=158755 RepID=A0A6J4LJQ3_9SPHI|nr:MAG: hypothetical protein AVDCRST_MAG56-7611 [uncultured Cytophagales bacterium]